MLTFANFYTPFPGILVTIAAPHPGDPGSNPAKSNFGNIFDIIIIE